MENCNSRFVEICVIVAFGFPEHLKTKKEVEMSKLIIESIPVSPFCQFALRNNKTALRFMVAVAVILLVLVSIFLPIWLAVLSVIAVVVLAPYVLSGLKRDEKMWLEINKRDHYVSTQLEEILKTFYAYTEQDIYRASVVEIPLEKLWYPRYAQYFSGDRGLSGDVSVSGVMGGLFGASGLLSGKVVGSVGPDSLADLGAVIILQNENGQTIRVVIPHRQVAEQMFAAALRSFNKDEVTFKTLTSLHVLRFSTYLPKKACVTFVSALRVLDKIVASCGEPLDERPVVKVYGQEVSPGVIMATAMEIEGERGVFIPTGYFKEVTDKLSEFLGAYRGDVAMLLDGQGPFAPKKAQPVV
ncbi:MAG: hypothetical protein WBC83_03475 [Minisyncoccia bacterium]